MARRLSELYRTAFVTGASGGLGRAFAEMLLAEGVRVWGTARDLARLDGLASGRTSSVDSSAFTPVRLDLGDAIGAETALVGAMQEAGGAFDLVIQNAGYGVFGEFDAANFTAWQAQLEAMLIATARLSHAALRAMRRREHGCLVHVSSLAVELPLPFMSGYNVAKAGLSALSESLMFETRGTGISIVDFRPGDYRTAFNRTMLIQTKAALSAATSEPAANDARLMRAWQTLETDLQAGPPPTRAAADLRRALLRRRHGVVRSGSFFQARLASLFARVAPASLVRRAVSRYFGSI